LPGGFGTAEELVETITWSQLRIHDKPVGALNTNGFYQHLIDWMDTAHREGFIDDRSRRILVVDDEPEKLLAKLLTYEDPLAGKHAYGLSKQMWNGNSNKTTSSNAASHQPNGPTYRI
jgi:predicted Rossmann-fold nucleotide-binding protein